MSGPLTTPVNKGINADMPGAPSTADVLPARPTHTHPNPPNPNPRPNGLFSASIASMSGNAATSEIPAATSSHFQEQAIIRRDLARHEKEKQDDRDRIINRAQQKADVDKASMRVHVSAVGADKPNTLNNSTSQTQPSNPGNGFQGPPINNTSQSQPSNQANGLQGPTRAQMPAVASPGGHFAGTRPQPSTSQANGFQGSPHVQMSAVATGNPNALIDSISYYPSLSQANGSLGPSRAQVPVMANPGGQFAGIARNQPSSRANESQGPPRAQVPGMATGNPNTPIAGTPGNKPQNHAMGTGNPNTLIAGTSRNQTPRANLFNAPSRAPKVTTSRGNSTTGANNTPLGQAPKVMNNNTPLGQAPKAVNALRTPSLPANPVTPQTVASNSVRGSNSVRDDRLHGFSPLVPTPRGGPANMPPPPPQQAATQVGMLQQTDSGDANTFDPLARKGTSMFPKFDDGDVLIMSPTSKTWKLHSVILANASPRFKEIFTKMPPYKLTQKIREEGATVKWRVVMTFEKDAHDLDPNSLMFKDFKAIEQNDKKSIQFNNINGLGTQAGYDKLYDNLFRCIYNLEPSFTDDIMTGEARQFILDATQLLQAAVFLDTVHSVRVIIEAHLLRLNQLLWYHIANRPEGWVHLAARLESPLMFREAMLHIVGKFHLHNGVDVELLKRPSFGDAGQTIWILINRKAAYLKQLKLNTERHLLEYYPSRMVHKEDQEAYVPGRATYANDIYLWMALTLFRQYVGSSYAMNYHHRAADGGLAFYRTLGTAEATYIRKNTLEAFHRSFDMSSKGKACLQQAIDAIKSDIKPCLSKLLVDRSQATRSPNAPRLKHLTCTEIADVELPWYVAPPPQAPADVVMVNAPPAPDPVV